LPFETHLPLVLNYTPFRPMDPSPLPALTKSFISGYPTVNFSRRGSTSYPLHTSCDLDMVWRSLTAIHL
jgi:hypothetical protein